MTNQIKKFNYEKTIKKHIMRKLKRWIVPILIGAGAVLFFKSEAGKNIFDSLKGMFGKKTQDA